MPTLRTIPPSTSTPIQETRTTTELQITARLSTTIKQIQEPASFPIAGIIGILIGSFAFILLVSYIVIRLRRHAQAKLTTSDTSNLQERLSLTDALRQYRITTRTNAQAKRRSTAYIAQNSPPTKLETHQSLVAIEC